MWLKDTEIDALLGADYRAGYEYNGPEIEDAHGVAITPGRVAAVAQALQQSRRDMETLERLHDATSEELERLRKVFASQGEASISLQHYRETVETYYRWATSGRYYPQKESES